MQKRNRTTCSSPKNLSLAQQRHLEDIKRNRQIKVERLQTRQKNNNEIRREVTKENQTNVDIQIDSVNEPYTTRQSLFQNRCKTQDV